MRITDTHDSAAQHFDYLEDDEPDAVEQSTSNATKTDELDILDHEREIGHEELPTLQKIA